MNSPFEQIEQLRVGAIDFVSPNEIKATLDIDAPESLALNATFPRSFPRVNSYVLASSDNGFLVGQIEWIAVERSPYPKRKGLQDFGLIDLPYPLRRISITPIGTLRSGHRPSDPYKFSRGIENFPSVGDSIFLPLEDQLRSIVESGSNRRVTIGTSPLAGNATVAVDPDRVFGRHIAVLGNTGSGKSCSVAGLIQWSLEATGKTNPNARFIILDPNGEYEGAFGTSAKYKAKIYKVDSEIKDHELKVPNWLWNSAEWGAFTQASPKVQLPILKKSLRAMRNNGLIDQGSPEAEIQRYLRQLILILKDAKFSGTPFQGFPGPKNFCSSITKWHQTLLYLEESHQQGLLIDSIQTFETYVESRSGRYPTWEASALEVDQLINCIDRALESFGPAAEAAHPINEDTPIPFQGENLISHIEGSAREMGAEQYIEYLISRIKVLTSDPRMHSISNHQPEMGLLQWIENHLGSEDDDRCVTVLDLSIVPSEIVHITTAVISRVIFEALQRYKRIYGAPLPTVLVAEEAHTFIKRYKDTQDQQDISAVCCQVFEKIAREGRKFGLGLVVSSQRPSELSPTVLSQCNSFLLHRISNDKDQEQIERMVPDALRGLLRELPALPSQHAILMGWASELPILVRMRDVFDKPRSDDPDFWDVWNRHDNEGFEVKRPADWQPVVQEWQGIDE